MHKRAIVIGASMVGLAVARALSESFQEVVLIDRDRMPTGEPDHRPGDEARDAEADHDGFVDRAAALENLDDVGGREDE